MKLTEKQQLIAIIVGSAMLVLGEITFALLSYSDRGELRTELGALEHRQVQAEGKLNLIPQLQLRAQEMSEIVEQYTEILPREDEVSPDAFLDDISALCKEVGLEITSAQPIEVKVEQKKRLRGRTPQQAKNEAAPPAKNFVQHKYRFEMEGKFSALHRFINGVENHTRFLQVDHLLIEQLASRGRNNQSKLERSQNPRKALTVEVSTYTYSALPQNEGVSQ